METGDFVAVKRFPLTAIDDESLGSIQAEIEMMQRLNHPNIVKYIDTIRTTDHLHIVLEYIENGSLSYVLRKFGSFSESLVAIYVAQILRGLAYLHAQVTITHNDSITLTDGPITYERHDLLTVGLSSCLGIQLAAVETSHYYQHYPYSHVYIYLPFCSSSGSTAS